ncbi:hypothetical protein [Maribacter sp. 2210JD10-5]|uniref:hypothetical protein n=1 Tax=Maribacter sp. 2210JD10-5 TaxID=3386272 RepID=UPI0039BD8893
MEKSDKILKTPIRIALVTLLCGMIMRVLNVSYSAGIIFTAFLAILILYFLRFSKKRNKQPVAYIKMVLVLFWATNGLLKILDFPYTLIFQIGTGVTFITWFAMEGTAYFMDEDRKTKNSMLEIVWNFSMVMGVLIIICGSLMHLLDWDYAISTLTVGLTIVTAYILKDIFRPLKEKNPNQNDEEFLL